MARTFEPAAFDVALTKITYHEGSTIFSYDCETEIPMAELQEKLSKLLAEVRDEVDRQDGIIGHIKAFVEDSGASVSMSCTGDDIYATQGRARKIVMHFAAILFSVEEDPIVELLDEVFSEL